MADFEAIYTEYFTDVYRYVFSLCKNETLAEEITQEAFYRAMTHIDGFDGRCRLFVWLCQIAKNTYYSYLKKQKRLADPDAAETLSSDIFIESRLCDKEDARRLHQLLHALPEPYKEVFSLRVFGELPFSQIGALFGKTESWARLIFYRAKKR